MYALFDFSAMPTRTASHIGILLAVFFCFAIYVGLFMRREDIDEQVLLGVSVLFCIGVPFLLPHMHDRYFFMADVLTFAMAVAAPRMAAVPLLVSFGSILGYHAYLKMRFLLPMRWGGAAIGLALVLTAGWVIFSLDRGKKVLTKADDLI